MGKLLSAAVQGLSICGFQITTVESTSYERWILHGLFASKHERYRIGTGLKRSVGKVIQIGIE